METKSRFEICQASRAGVLSSLVALASAGSLLGQELPDQQPLTLEELQLLRPLGEACTVTFGSEQDQQILVRSSTDLECWVFAGGCDEINQGSYQFIDLGAAELPGQYYQFESFDSEIQLPPQFEQLRAQLGEEGFAQWLQSNLDQFGTLQGLTPEEIEAMDEVAREQFEDSEDLLNFWLKDLNNESAPLLPELELPPQFEVIRSDWGDYDFAKLLVGHLDSMGNLQGICEPLVIEWEQHEPILFEEFQQEEQVLVIWLDDYLEQLPPIILENFEEEQKELPPHLEQIRQEIGDENFAQWLKDNADQSGNLQGIPESEIPEEGTEAREEFDILEGDLQTWLSDFTGNGLQ